MVDHIDHVVKVTGSADHVGLGSDFDGISATPVGLENAGKLGAITRELLRRGYKEADVRKILGGNFYRVFEAVEKAAKKLAPGDFVIPGTYFILPVILPAVTPFSL